MKIKKNDRWIQKWEVPSSSSDKVWIVVTDSAGNYGCSCPIWKFKRRECHHIKLVKNNGGKEINQKKPKYILAKVLKPKYDEKSNKLYIPLVPFGNISMEATICYYMLKYGFSREEIKEKRRLPDSWTAEAIMDYVEHHGEAEYPEDRYK